MAFKNSGWIPFKIALALVLTGFSVIAAAGTMRCFFGLPMEPALAVEAPVDLSQCCPSTLDAPVPIPSKAPCCCIVVMEKSIVEVNGAAPVSFSIDFPLILAPTPSFEFNPAETWVPQIRWPEVHGPPGITVSTGPARAPPKA